MAQCVCASLARFISYIRLKSLPIILSSSKFFICLLLLLFLLFFSLLRRAIALSANVGRATYFISLFLTAHIYYVKRSIWMRIKKKSGTSLTLWILVTRARRVITTRHYRHQHRADSTKEFDVYKIDFLENKTSYGNEEETIDHNKSYNGAFLRSTVPAVTV